MGKVILMPNVRQKKIESRNNIQQLKVLVNKYISIDKKRVINKIKNEQ